MLSLNVLVPKVMKIDMFSSALFFVAFSKHILSCNYAKRFIKVLFLAEFFSDP